MKTTVNDLRNAGYKVYVTHRRQYINVFNYDKNQPYFIYLTDKEAAQQGLTKQDAEFCQKGGRVNVTIYLPDNTISADAVCSQNDQYNKKLGREIALGRVLQKMEKLGVLDLTHGEIGV